jgi:hypothetical protein
MAFLVSAQIKRIKKFTSQVTESKITLIFNDTVRMQKDLYNLVYRFKRPAHFN